jgi:uncharacterized protein YoxC
LTELKENKTMKRIVLLVYFLATFAFPNFGITSNDSTYNKTESLQFESLNSKVDSLLKVTAKFNEEKNYFTTALNSQTMIFSIIITITLFLFGLISFVNMKFEIKKYKEETESIINRQNDIIESVKGKNNKHDELINSALGNLNALIAEYYNTNERVKFKYAINAARFQQTKEPYDTALVNLNKALDITKKDYFDTLFDDITERDMVIEDNLKILINSKNEEIVKTSLAIYLKYLEVKEKNGIKT